MKIKVSINLKEREKKKTFFDCDVFMLNRNIQMVTTVICYY